jgi:hypothetical protein
MWKSVSLEEDDLGISFVAERPYTGNLGLMGGHKARDWQSNIVFERPWFNPEEKSIRMGFMEEGESPVMTKPELFDIYNDKEDFRWTPSVVSWVWMGAIPLILLIFGIFCCIYCVGKCKCKETEKNNKTEPGDETEKE